MSWLFSKYLSQGARHSFVEEFNKSNSKYRAMLADSILLHQNELTSDEFGSDAVSFLLASLNRKMSFNFRGHLLGQTATEKFVVNRLLPLVSDDPSPLQANLREVLRQAGSRHGKRFVFN